MSAPFTIAKLLPVAPGSCTRCNKPPMRAGKLNAAGECLGCQLADQRERAHALAYRAQRLKLAPKPAPVEWSPSDAHGYAQHSYSARMADEAQMFAFARCGCGAYFTRAEFEALPTPRGGGEQPTTCDAGKPAVLHMRNCTTCGSTLARELP